MNVSVDGDKHSAASDAVNRRINFTYSRSIGGGGSEFTCEAVVTDNDAGLTVICGIGQNLLEPLKLSGA